MEKLFALMVDLLILNNHKSAKSLFRLEQAFCMSSFIELYGAFVAGSGHTFYDEDSRG